MSEVRVAEIRKQRATAVERVGVLAAIEGAFTADQETEFTALETQVKGFDAELTRIERARTMSAATATPVRDQEVESVLSQVCLSFGLIPFVLHDLCAVVRVEEVQ